MVNEQPEMDVSSVRTLHMVGTAMAYVSLLTLAKVRTSSQSRCAAIEHFISIGRTSQGSEVVVMLAICVGGRFEEMRNVEGGEW